MNEIFVESESPDGLHQCIVEGDERSVWAYLHSKERKEVLSDAPVCSLTPLVSVKEFKECYHGEGAPPFVEGCFSADSVEPELENERIEILWRDSGPEITIDQRTVSKLEYGMKAGLSAYILKECPFGRPLTPKGEPDASGQRR